MSFLPGTSSNLLLLPQLSMSVTIVNNAGWYDSFVVPDPNGLPLDLTGLNFHSELRLAPTDPNNKLDMTTTDSPPTMTNGLTTGVLGWAVPFSMMVNIVASVYSMDIVATEVSTGNQKSMFETGPAVVTVLMGVTR